MKLWIFTNPYCGLFEITRVLVAAETEEAAREMVYQKARELAEDSFRPDVVEQIAAFWKTEGKCEEYVPSKAGIIVCDWRQP